MSESDFKPKYTSYYPGPYSLPQYHVVIVYFFDEDYDLAIDAAIELQQYYGGSYERHDFNCHKIHETVSMESYINPVSIYNCSNEFEDDGFIKIIAEEFLYVDEILLIGSDRESKYKDYLIAACELLRLPVFSLERKDGFFLKTEVTHANKNLLSKFSSELMEDSELENVRIIRLSSYYDPSFYGEIFDPETDNDCKREIDPDLFFPNVPLKLSRRFYEWLGLWNIYSDESGLDKLKYRQELDFLVGAFNYYLKGEINYPKS